MEKKIVAIKSPKLADSVTPVVAGSTKRFCIKACMISPPIASEAPEIIIVIVRGNRDTNSKLISFNVARPEIMANSEISPVPIANEMIDKIISKMAMTK